MGLADCPPFCKTDGCERVPQVYIKGSFRCPSCAVKVQMGTLNRIVNQDSPDGAFQGGVVKHTALAASAANRHSLS
jgi:hypothetical protein